MVQYKRYWQQWPSATSYWNALQWSQMYSEPKPAFFEYNYGPQVRVGGREGAREGVTLHCKMSTVGFRWAAVRWVAVRWAAVRCRHHHLWGASAEWWRWMLTLLLCGAAIITHGELPLSGQFTVRVAMDADAAAAPPIHPSFSQYNLSLIRAPNVLFRAGGWIFLSGLRKRKTKYQNVCPSCLVVAVHQQPNWCAWRAGKDVLAAPQDTALTYRCVCVVHRLSRGGADFLHGMLAWIIAQTRHSGLLPRPPACCVNLAFVLLWPSASSLQQDASSGITSLRTTATW